MSKQQEVTVHLRANANYAGQPYLVKTGENGEVSVFSIITRSPVNPRGFYQNETVYRTIKPGSANYRAAVKAAGAAQ